MRACWTGQTGQDAEGEAEKRRLELTVSSTDRAFGTLFGAEITRQSRGLPAG